jgi:hypothetical protein
MTYDETRYSAWHVDLRIPEVSERPYAGELQVRFDEGEQDGVSRKILDGHEAGNGGHSQEPT